jgi:TolB-like protein/Flp pilus assembly protein TadD
LGLLLSEAGETVTRERIIESLWGAELNVDFEHGINRCIREVRAILVDHAVKPRYIRTVARRGYRFIQPVSIVDDTSRVARSAAPSRKTTEAIYSLVVLPFANFSGAANDDAFSDGLTEEIINVLTQLPHLRVIARTSAFAFKGKNEDIRAIGSALGVDYVVEGSLRRAGANIRVTVQLIRASDGIHLLSKRYDHELIDIFRVQDQIAEDVGNLLQVQFRLRPSYVPVFAAYESFLEGRHHLRRFSPDGFKKALHCFDRAAQLDPNYSRPLVGIAEYWSALAFEYAGRPVDLLPRAIEAATRAVVLDDRDGDAHLALARSLVMLEYRWDRARRHYERARKLTLASNVRIDYAYWFLLPQGRLKEALDEGEDVVKSDPLLLFGHCLKTSVLLAMRNYDAAAVPCLRALEIDPQFGHALRLLALVRAYQGRFEDAHTLARRMVELRGRDVLGLDALGIVSALTGDRVTAYNVIDELMKLPSGANAPSRLATIYCILGDLDHALQSLEKGVEVRDPRILWARNLPWFDSLRSHPRYAAFLRTVNLQPSA